MKIDNLFKWGNIVLINSWLIFFGLIPHLLIFAKSLLVSEPCGHWLFSMTFMHYYKVLFSTVYLKIFWNSFSVASVCTLSCLIIAYPFAYLLAQIKSKYKPLILVLIVIPFWTSSLVRIYAIVTFLKAKGILNNTLIALGLIQEPLQLLHTNLAVMIGLVYDLLPFMILPLYTTFERLDKLYIYAARDLGAHNLSIFWRIIIPLTMPGIVSGSILVFLPAMSLFYIPIILGGSKSLFLGNLIQRHFLINNWALGSTLSIVLLVTLILFLSLIRRIQKQQDFYQGFV